MTAPVVDQTVACGTCPPGAACLPASHSMQLVGGGWKYLGCRVHRACTEYTTAPPADQTEPTPSEDAYIWEAADAPQTEPPAQQHDEPAATADRPADSATEPVGQLLLSGRCWYCPACITARERNRPCCGTPLIRARVTVRRDDADE